LPGVKGLFSYITGQKCILETQDKSILRANLVFGGNWPSYRRAEYINTPDLAKHFNSHLPLACPPTNERTHESWAVMLKDRARLGEYLGPNGPVCESHGGLPKKPYRVKPDRQVDVSTFHLIDLRRERQVPLPGRRSLSLAGVPEPEWSN
jgi:hypothetical protein